MLMSLMPRQWIRKARGCRDMKHLSSIFNTLLFAFALLYSATVYAQVAPSTVAISGSGVQPGSFVSATFTTVDQDGTSNSYNHNVTADASGSFTLPVMNAEYISELTGTINYRVVMRNPQPSTSATFDTNIFPVLNQSFSIDWNRLLGGVNFSGQMTPYGTINASSPEDPSFGYLYEEFDDNNEENGSHLFTGWLGDLSVGDYSTPAMYHGAMDTATTQINAIIQNMTDPVTYCVSNIWFTCGHPVTRTGTFSPIHQTSFSIDIETDIPPLPPSQGTNLGNPSSGGGNGAVVAAAAAASFIASALFGSVSVNDTFAGEALQGLTRQLTVNSQKETEMESTLSTNEQTDTAQREIQSQKYESAAELQVDESVCEVITVAQSSQIESKLNSEAKRRVLRKNIMDSATGHKGTLGAMSTNERVQVRVEELTTKYCSDQGNNGGMADLCNEASVNPDDVYKHLDPSCVMGWKTIDGDALQGAPNEACMMFLSYVTPANEPVPLPSETQLEKFGAEEYDAAIMEYYNPLIQHGSLVADTLATMHAKTQKAENSVAVDEFKALLEELDFSPEEIALYIPDNTSGLSENAQLELVSKFMVGNPGFMLKMQTNEANIARIRTLLRGISLRLDSEIADLAADKGRHMAAINALMLRDDREAANASLQAVSQK